MIKNIDKNTKRKSVKNIYNQETGLPIMANLYMIRTLYYHMKKHPKFIEHKEIGKKEKSIDIYQNVIPMARQRFNRINKGENFELSSAEATQIIDTFGIDIKYFRRDNPIMFELENISLTDWKCFYNVKYKCNYNMPSGYKSEYIMKRANEIETRLKEMPRAGYVTVTSDDSPLSMIYYYFANGEKYESVSKLSKCIETLSSIDFTEWEKESIEKLTEYSKQLRNHSDYISSLLTIFHLRK